MLISSMTSMITDSLDRVLLGAHLGARFVTYYTVPQNLVTRLNMLPNALVRTFFRACPPSARGCGRHGASRSSS